MDFKALSITILAELAEPNSDKDYIAAKLRACIDQDANALYEVMDIKNKALQKNLMDSTTQITTLTEKHTTLRQTVGAEFQLEKNSLLGTIAEKEAYLSQARTTFAQMNEYIAKMNTEMETLKASLTKANDELAIAHKKYAESDVACLSKELKDIRAIADQRKAELDILTTKYYCETKEYNAKIASLTYKLNCYENKRAW
jgi:chromosome segregation ATPase